jgi:DNA-directed RNA polymerase subunit RPC12/RpoP
MALDNQLFLPENSQRSVCCPYCGSTRTELFSLFGQQLLTVQYYCQGCHTPFEYVKDDTMRDEREAIFVARQRSLGE